MFLCIDLTVSLIMASYVMQQGNNPFNTNHVHFLNTKFWRRLHIPHLWLALKRIQAYGAGRTAK